MPGRNGTETSGLDGVVVVPVVAVVAAVDRQQTVRAKAVGRGEKGLCRHMLQSVVRVRMRVYQPRHGDHRDASNNNFVVAIAVVARLDFGSIKNSSLPLFGAERQFD